MAMKYFCFYHSYAQSLASLSNAQVGRLIRALLAYSRDGEVPKLAGAEQLAFDFIAQDIDRAREAYERRCRINREIAGRRRKAQPTSGEEPELEEPEEPEELEDW